MTEKLGFFTPLRYPANKFLWHNIIETVEGYFYLGSQVAQIISTNERDSSQRVEIRNNNQQGATHYLVCVIKVISYCTPLLMYGVKQASKVDLRFRYQFDMITKCSFFIPAIMFAIKIAFRFTNQLYVVSASPQKNTVTEVKSEVLVPTPISSPLKEADTTVASLMEQFTKAWDDAAKDFNFSESFDLDRFTTLLTDHADRFEKKEIIKEDHYGYIEKFDLDPTKNPQVYVRADLHGDLKSLIENLRTLQEQKLLDHQFKCQSGVHLVFLGDYCDRGIYGTQILEMLMRLKEENPQQVHLIRGNHESILLNLSLGYPDSRLRSIVQDKTAQQALQRFYETLSLTIYLSVRQSEKREYIQCTHGLFEPTMDPALLLDQGNSGDYLPVPKKRRFSERIQQIPNDNSELSQSSQKVKQLVKNQYLGDFMGNLYNWGDVTTSEESSLMSPTQRAYEWCAEDIQHYFKISSEHHRVMILLRGHAHQFQHAKYQEKVIVTTLPLGMDCGHYASNYGNQPDRAYILTPAPQVENWTKMAILRAAGHSVTDKVTDPYPLVSSEI